MSEHHNEALSNSEESNSEEFTFLDEMLTLARQVGWGASRVLMSYYRENEDGSSRLKVKDQGDGPVTEADLVVNHYIVDKLQLALQGQDFAYLTEETFKQQSPSERLNRPWVWIIDPLDGTKDFIRRTGEFAIHIALAYQGRPVVAVVACPVAKKLLYARAGGGSFVEQPAVAGGYSSEPLRVSHRSQAKDLTVVVSPTHRDDRFDVLLDRLPCKEKLYVGSVGCKIAAIVEQRADVYISLSGKSAPKDWDMAAPELILTEAGGQFTYFDQSPAQYNREDVNQWGGIMATNGHCHTELCTLASQILTELTP